MSWKLDFSLFCVVWLKTRVTNWFTTALLLRKTAAIYKTYESTTYALTIVNNLFSLSFPNWPLISMFAHRWHCLNFSYHLMPWPGFEPTSVRELSLFEGPLKGRSSDWATANAFIASLNILQRTTAKRREKTLKLCKVLHLVYFCHWLAIPLSEASFLLQESPVGKFSISGLCIFLKDLSKRCLFRQKQHLKSVRSLWEGPEREQEKEREREREWTRERKTGFVRSRKVWLQLTSSFDFRFRFWCPGRTITLEKNSINDPERL